MIRKTLTILVVLILGLNFLSINIIAKDKNDIDPLDYFEEPYPGMIINEEEFLRKINDNNPSTLQYIPPPISGEIGDWIDDISESTVQNYIQGLVNFGPRVTGTAACYDAGDYIYNEFVNMGITANYHYWYDGTNIEGVLEGVNTSSDKIFIVCGHYDSVSGSPGADDNAAGTVAAIAAAEILSQYEFQHTIKFVAFSGEEQGLIGSSYYCQDAVSNGDNIIAALNADMIGFALSQSDGNQVKIYDNAASQWLTDYATDIANVYQNEIGPLTVLDSGSTYGSDHTSFHNNGYDSIFYHEYNFHDYYHSPQDNMANLNLTYDAKVTRFIVATLAELAEPILLDADFTYSPDYPNTGEIISFTDQSLGDVISRTWNFGDGQTSHQINPTHIYNNDGAYVVNLTIYDSEGKTDSIEKEIGVWDNWPPQAVATPEFYAGNDPIVNFDGSASWDPDGTVVSYHWDFDDGQTSTQMMPSHSYSADGIYDVILTVTDDGGKTGSTNCEIRIDAYTPPETDIIYTGSYGNNGWYNSNVQIILNATDWSGVDHSEYNIDGEDWHLYENPFRIYVNGEHTIGAFSVDIYGNIEDPVYSTFKMDNEKPTLNVAIDGDQSNGWYITPVKVTCTADDQVSGINAIFYRLEKDDIFDEEWFEYDGPILIDEDGEYILRVYSEDIAGNTRGKETAYPINIDTGSPNTICNLIGEGSNNNFYLEVEIEIFAEDFGSGVETTYYRIDRGNWIEYEDKFLYSDFGDHTIDYYSVDNIGNEEEFKSIDFKISKLNFIIEIQKPENGLYLFGNKFLNIQKTIIIGSINTEAVMIPFGDDEPDFDYVEFYVDDILKSTVESAPFEWNWNESTFGNHILKVVAINDGESIEESIDVLTFIF